MPASINEPYFFGIDEEYINLLPEPLADGIINLLKINPNEIAEEIMLGKTLISKTRKTKLREDLVRLIKFNNPQTVTPSDIKKLGNGYIADLKRCSITLKKMHYEGLYKGSVISAEYQIADRSRRASYDRTKDKIAIYASGVAPQLKEMNGVWPELYTFDKELNKAIDALEKLERYITIATEKVAKEVTQRGNKKSANDANTKLYYELSRLYKGYAGHAPKIHLKDNSSSKAIKFFQLILPYTNSKTARTAPAIHKRILRLKQSKEFGHLWSDTKS